MHPSPAPKRRLLARLLHAATLAGAAMTSAVASCSTYAAPSQAELPPQVSQAPRGSPGAHSGHAHAAGQPCHAAVAAATLVP